MHTDEVHKYLKSKGLTSVAKFAKDLALSHSTIQAVFDELVSIGVLESKVINGTTYYKLKR